MGYEATHRVQILQREFFAGDSPVSIANQLIYPRSVAKEAGGDLEDLLKSRGEKFWAYPWRLTPLRGKGAGSSRQQDLRGGSIPQRAAGEERSRAAGDLFPYTIDSSLGRKEWCRLFVDCLTPLRWDSKDWDSLVMNEKEILALRSLVTTHEYSNDAQDPLERKGLIILLLLLKKLEYFSGIVILTTNRVSSFDPAMKSGVHLALTYNPLEARTRHRIWTQHLRATRRGETEIDRDSAIGSLAQVRLNSREIANALNTAKTTTRSEGKPLRFGHIGTALEVSDVFEKSSTTGSKDASSSS
ncbi:hypothetical protein DL768_002872 [Monosporascus sp. mg162]|nr:hypothetical protein DL768_002872 [Monosporascus sp. mg162]